MSIVERSKITSAYARAVALGASHSEACATVARALGIDVEIVFLDGVYVRNSQ